MPSASTAFSVYHIARARILGIGPLAFPCAAAGDLAENAALVPSAQQAVFVCPFARASSARISCTKKPDDFHHPAFSLRRERDSNPRTLSGQRFSRPPHSTTLPSLQFPFGTAKVEINLYSAKNIVLFFRKEFPLEDHEV